MVSGSSTDEKRFVKRLVVRRPGMGGVFLGRENAAFDARFRECYIISQKFSKP